MTQEFDAWIFGSGKCHVLKRNEPLQIEQFKKIWNDNCNNKGAFIRKFRQDMNLLKIFTDAEQKCNQRRPCGGEVGFINI